MTVIDIETPHGPLVARYRAFNVNVMHSAVYDDFRRLIHGLELDHTHGKLGTLFQPFETYRHPLRSSMYYHGAGDAWFRDPHCFGLAITFAAWDQGRASFAPTKPWHEIADRCRGWGYVEDRNRVIHHHWEDFRACLNSM